MSITAQQGNSQALNTVALIYYPQGSQSDVMGLMASTLGGLLQLGQEQ